MTTSAITDTISVASSPSGRSSSPMPIRKMAPIAAPITVRRPPSTAAMMICTPTPTSTKVETEAVPM